MCRSIAIQGYAILPSCWKAGGLYLIPLRWQRRLIQEIIQSIFTVLLCYLLRL